MPGTPSRAWSGNGMGGSDVLVNQTRRVRLRDGNWGPRSVDAMRRDVRLPKRFRFWLTSSIGFVTLIESRARVRGDIFFRELLVVDLRL